MRLQHLDGHRGRAADPRLGSDVLVNDGSRIDDGSLSNRDPRQNDGVRTNKTVVSNTHVAVVLVDPIVRQDSRPKGHHRVLPNVDTPGIGLVELGTARNNGSFPYVHFPNPHQVLALERAHDAVGQLITYEGD